MLNRYAEWITIQNRVIRFLRCDFDPIFKGQEFKSAAESFMIEMSYSAPYTPTRNTMAKRRWGMAAPATRAVLHTTQLKPSYREFAMLNACYLNNRTWHHSFEGVPDSRSHSSRETFQISTISRFLVAQHLSTSQQDNAEKSLTLHSLEFLLATPPTRMGT